MRIPHIYIEPQYKELNTIFTEMSALLIKYRILKELGFYYIKVNKRENTKDSN